MLLFGDTIGDTIIYVKKVYQIEHILLRIPTGGRLRLSSTTRSSSLTRDYQEQI